MSQPKRHKTTLNDTNQQLEKPLINGSKSRIMVLLPFVARVRFFQRNSFGGTYDLWVMSPTEDQIIKALR